MAALQKTSKETREESEMPIGIQLEPEITNNNFGYTKLSKETAMAVKGGYGGGGQVQESSIEQLALVKNGQSKSNMTRHRHKASKLMTFSIIVMITGFTFATPLSLILTIPAYILADRAEVVQQQEGKHSRRYKCLRNSSILLMLATIILGFATSVLIIAIYIYFVYPQMYH